ncbi:MAG: hypothetical protein ACLFWB_03245, partial [Armatimonadota bacterium]
MALKYTVALAALLSLTLLCGVRAMDQERIAVSTQHPTYWNYAGETVLLLGGSDEDNLFNDPEMMAGNLDALAACGGNYIRCTLSWRDENNVPPFEMTHGKYDLNRLNPEFFTRLKQCCQKCEERNIILQIEFWATFDYYRDNWAASPWNPVNNITYTLEETHLKAEWPHHPSSRVQPFFESVPEVNDDTEVLRHQRRFVQKVLEVTLPYPNVLYCLDNETKAPPEWAVYWGDFITDAAEGQETPVNVTEMWDNWNINSPDHANTYRHPELFSYCDVSQNNWMSGQTHYDRLIQFRDNLGNVPGGPRPMNNVKIYGRRPPEGNSLAEENVERFWRAVFAGCASARFHRPDSGLGLNEKARATIQADRTFTDSFDLFECQPRPDLLRDCEPNEAYLLADPPTTFALYFPAGGSVTLTSGDDVGMRGEYRLRWFDTAEAAFAKPTTLTADGAVQITTPDDGRNRLAL